MSASRAERARVVPLAVSHHAANTSAANLALPQSVLDAGGGNQGLVASGQGPFRVLHQHWTGYQSGVAAAFNFEPIMDLFYQGSVFGSSGAARAYMMESYNQLATGNSVPPKDCSSIIGDPCAIIGYVTTSDELAVYQVAQVNYCTIETGIQGDADLINANSDTVSKAAADTFLLGVQEAQAACTGASSNPQPTAVPPTPRPTVAPAPTARPTTAPLPTPLPTPTRSNGGTGTSATGLIFKANGAGSKTTRTLAVPGTWQLDWWYNCTATAKNGHFTITARDSGGTVSPQVSRYGREDHGQVQYHRGGRVSLAIKTPCHWHLKVYGQP